jgi:hypothetical protein
MTLRSILALLMLAIAGCSDDDTTNPDAAGGGTSNLNDPTGGWSGNGLYACFASNGGLGVGDHVGEAEMVSAGSWTKEGTLVVDGVPGTWSLAGSTLTLSLDCPEPDCGPFDYKPDASLDCEP